MNPLLLQSTPLLTMKLTAIIEALWVASDEPLPTTEIARLIRARVAELEDEVLAAKQENEDDGEDYSAENSTENAAPTVPEEIKAYAELDEEQVLVGLADLNKEYQETERAFTALERAKGWKIYTSPEFGGFVKHLFPGRKPKRLSGPAMETLAVVAYRQPVTKSAIDAVRGVSSDGMLQKLLDLELVKIGGRAELPGRPLLYETTDYFFEHFGIKSPDELPNALELRAMELPEEVPGEEEEAESEQDKPTESAEEEKSIPEEKQMPLAEPAAEAPEEKNDEPEIEDFAQPDPSQTTD